MELLAAALVGSAFTFFFGLLREHVQRKWSRSEERVRRAEERAEHATEEILRLLDEIAAALAVYPPASVDNERLLAATAGVRRSAVMLVDADAAHILSEIAECAGRYDAVIAYGPVSNVGGLSYIVRTEGQEAIRQMLSGEKVTKSATLEKCRDALRLQDDEYEALYSLQRRGDDIG
jgi:hypothetical protein